MRARQETHPWGPSGRTLSFRSLQPAVCLSQPCQVSPIRSAEFPYGLPGLSRVDTRKCNVANLLGLFCLEVLWLSLRLGFASSLEQPAASWMLRLPPFLIFIKQAGVNRIGLDFCAFGTAWRKRTVMLVVNADFQCLARRCPGCSCHQILRGRAPCGTAWTRLAEPYPPRLTAALARCLDHLVA